MPISPRPTLIPTHLAPSHPPFSTRPDDLLTPPHLHTHPHSPMLTSRCRVHTPPLDQTTCPPQPTYTPTHKPHTHLTLPHPHFSIRPGNPARGTLTLPSEFRPVHSTTSLNPVGSHRLFTWLTCVRTHARVLVRGILTLPMSRDNSLVSAARSVCTLHTRTCPPFICRHSHLTTFLIQAGSHRPSIWLICVCTHARALARGILPFIHVP